MKILAVSDIELGFIYNIQIAQRFKDVDLVISCGDLPYYYLEFIVSMLDKPLYYVRGNHASSVESTSGGDRSAPWGAIDIHRKVKRNPYGVLLAGIEGSLRYNLGLHQYSQAEMWYFALELVPRMLYNRLRYGRYVDILVTHAPPWHIHDSDDRPHQGIKAFRWLDKVFQPSYHLHGHIHVYRNDVNTVTGFGRTSVMNCYGYREFYFDPPLSPRPFATKSRDLAG
jgi:Icc-related predicted phosphoesterase